MQITGRRQIGIGFQSKAGAIRMCPDHPYTGFGNRLFANYEGDDRRTIATDEIASGIDVPEVPLIKLSESGVRQDRSHIGYCVKRSGACVNKRQ